MCLLAWIRPFASNGSPAGALRGCFVDTTTIASPPLLSPCLSPCQGLHSPSPARRLPAPRHCSAGGEGPAGRGYGVYGSSKITDQLTPLVAQPGALQFLLSELGGTTCLIRAPFPAVARTQDVLVQHASHLAWSHSCEFGVKRMELRTGDWARAARMLCRVSINSGRDPLFFCNLGRLGRTGSLGLLGRGRSHHPPGPKVPHRGFPISPTSPQGCPAGGEPTPYFWASLEAQPASSDLPKGTVPGSAWDLHYRL
jgi:hypothetical protein